MRRWSRWLNRRTLALALTLGLALVLWQSATLAREQALASLKRDADTELRLSATGLTGYLSRHEYLPELLATRETVKRYLSAPDGQDVMPLNRLLNRFRSTTGVSDIYLLDAEGTTLAASNWHRPDNFIGQNYRFRPYYQDAIAGALRPLPRPWRRVDGSRLLFLGTGLAR